MSQSRQRQFLVAVSLLLMAGFAMSAKLTPPDVYTQTYTTLGLLAVTVPLSYWLVYRRGLPV